MRTRQFCDACDDRGARFPCTPSCSIPALRRAWIVVEKRDSCDKFSDDLSAALAYFYVAGSFLCIDGGEHVLADSRTRKLC